MAMCDNLYGNSKQWQELHDFLSKNQPEDLHWMREDKPDPKSGEVRICYIAEIQEYLIENCPLPWVQEELEGNLRIQRFILGKAHHERENE